MSVRLALVGLGRWGSRLLPELAARFEVTACCTTGRVAGRAWLARQFPSIPLTTDVDDVLGDDSIAAVAVATPIESHFELAARALRAGKHVFVEKPVTVSLGDLDVLARLARGRRLVVFGGHVYLYHPVLERLLALTRDDPVVRARLEWRKLGTFDSDLFWNLVSHEISLATALLQDAPSEVEVVATAKGPTTCDAALVGLRFTGGRTSLIDVDRASPARSKTVSVTTSGGRNFVWHDDLLLELRGHAFVPVSVPVGQALGRELDAFRAAVESAEPFPSDLEHAAIVIETITRIREAAGYDSEV